MHRVGGTIRRGAALAAMLLVACGSDGNSTSATTPGAESATISGPGTASSTAAPFPIPNGTYTTTATRKEALKKGFSNKEIDRWYGRDGTQPLTLVLEDGTLQMFVVGDDGVKELGAMGTYTATKSQWVATSQSEGCSGCVYTYRWSFDGKVLSLKLLSGSAGPADFRAVKLVTEHEYLKVD